MKSIAISVLLLLVSGSVFSAQIPTTDEVKKVLDFYYNGQGLGVVLIDSKLCRDIHREGDEKNECAGDLAGQTVPKGEAVYLWMAYMVPKGGENQGIIIQFENGGIARMVKNVKVSGSLRYRTWKKVVFDRSGNWSVKIVHDSPEAIKELGSLTFNVDPQ